MNFDKFFLIISYAVVLCGFFALAASGGVGVFITTLFFATLITAWILEKTRWQISEKLGTGLIFLIVPLFYLDWKFQIIGFGKNDIVVAGVLARVILLLSAIKILQKKSDRDWIFLYLMSFFEVLLAAGLSISSLYLASLILYLFTAICAIIAFEVSKTSRSVNQNSSFKKSDIKDLNLTNTPNARLPLMAFVLLFLIILLATPLFFVLPRVGSAGMGSNSNGLQSVTGFSDSVNLGEIGRLLQNDQIVMRARVEKTGGKNSGSIHWRGVALDSFDNKKWSKSKAEYNEPFLKGEKNYFKVDYASDKDNLTIQTVYLEPISTPVLFTISRAVAVQGNFQLLRKDSEDALTFLRNSDDRLSYKVFSDTRLPDTETLRSDNENYLPEDRRYLQLPEHLDARIAGLAKQITEKSRNRFDKAKAIENYLQTQFGYSLEMKAQGKEPLADFLFNVREGHCEYFATAMAIMLRTQGIATRIVNGFQQGEYNETADIFVIKQKDAHSWVEVYFPGEDVWVAFDPTPFAGQDSGTTPLGIVGKFNSYLEALETFWIQYFVTYDNQEQNSLMRSVKNGFVDYQAKSSVWLSEMQSRLSDWWKEVRGDKGLQASAKAVAFGIGYSIAAVLAVFLMIFLYRKIKKAEFWQSFYNWLKQKNDATIVEFYERMQKVLAVKGFTRAAHQTPLEFAFALDMPEVVNITEKYHRVRFGEKNLSKDEAEKIENWLEKLEHNSAGNEKK